MSYAVDGKEDTATVEDNEKCLNKICLDLIEFLSSSQNEARMISVTELVENLKSSKRRAYDIINVLESLEIMARLEKNNYYYFGRKFLPNTLSKLKTFCKLSRFKEYAVKTLRKFNDSEFTPISIMKEVNADDKKGIIELPDTCTFDKKRRRFKSAFNGSVNRKADSPENDDNMAVDEQTEGNSDGLNACPYARSDTMNMKQMIFTSCQFNVNILKQLTYEKGYCTSTDFIQNCFPQLFANINTANRCQFNRIISSQSFWSVFGCASEMVKLQILPLFQNMVAHQKLSRTLEELSQFENIVQVDNPSILKIQLAELHRLMVESTDKYCGVRPDEMSLGILSQKFLMILLIDDIKFVSLEDSAKILLGKHGDFCREDMFMKYKTKIRRLYDIAKILSALRLVERKFSNVFGRYVYTYCGPPVTTYNDCKSSIDLLYAGFGGISYKHSIFDLYRKHFGHCWSTLQFDEDTGCIKSLDNVIDKQNLTNGNVMQNSSSIVLEDNGMNGKMMVVDDNEKQMETLKIMNIDDEGNKTEEIRQFHGQLLTKRDGKLVPVMMTKPMMESMGNEVQWKPLPIGDVFVECNLLKSKAKLIATLPVDGLPTNMDFISLLNQVDYYEYQISKGSFCLFTKDKRTTVDFDQLSIEINRQQKCYIRNINAFKKYLCQDKVLSSENAHLNRINPFSLRGFFIQFKNIKCAILFFIFVQKHIRLMHVGGQVQIRVLTEVKEDCYVDVPMNNYGYDYRSNKPVKNNSREQVRECSTISTSKNLIFSKTDNNNLSRLTYEDDDKQTFLVNKAIGAPKDFIKTNRKRKIKDDSDNSSMNLYQQYFQYQQMVLQQQQQQQLPNLDEFTSQQYPPIFYPFDNGVLPPNQQQPQPPPPPPPDTQYPIGGDGVFYPSNNINAMMVQNFYPPPDVVNPMWINQSQKSIENEQQHEMSDLETINFNNNNNNDTKGEMDEQNQFNNSNNEGNNENEQTEQVTQQEDQQYNYNYYNSSSTYMSYPKVEYHYNYYSSLPPPTSNETFVMPQLCSDDMSQLPSITHGTNGEMNQMFGTPTTTPLIHPQISNIPFQFAPLSTQEQIFMNNLPGTSENSCSNFYNVHSKVFAGISYVLNHNTTRIMSMNITNLILPSDLIGIPLLTGHQHHHRCDVQKSRSLANVHVGRIENFGSNRYKRRSASINIGELTRLRSLNDSATKPDPLLRRHPLFISIQLSILVQMYYLIHSNFYISSLKNPLSKLYNVLTCYQSKLQKHYIDHLKKCSQKSEQMSQEQQETSNQHHPQEKLEKEDFLSTCVINKEVEEEIDDDEDDGTSSKYTKLSTCTDVENKGELCPTKYLCSTPVLESMPKISIDLNELRNQPNAKQRRRIISIKKEIRRYLKYYEKLLAGGNLRTRKMGVIDAATTFHQIVKLIEEKKELGSDDENIDELLYRYLHLSTKLLNINADVDPSRNRQIEPAERSNAINQILKQRHLLIREICDLENLKKEGIDLSPEAQLLYNDVKLLDETTIQLVQFSLLSKRFFSESSMNDSASSSSTFAVNNFSTLPSVNTLSKKREENKKNNDYNQSTNSISNQMMIGESRNNRTNYNFYENSRNDPSTRPTQIYNYYTSNSISQHGREENTLIKSETNSQILDNSHNFRNDEQNLNNQKIQEKLSNSLSNQKLTNKIYYNMSNIDKDCAILASGIVNSYNDKYSCYIPENNHLPQRQSELSEEQRQTSSRNTETIPPNYTPIYYPMMYNRPAMSFYEPQPPQVSQQDYYSYMHNLASNKQNNVPHEYMSKQNQVDDNSPVEIRTQKVENQSEIIFEKEKVCASSKEYAEEF
ncbi:hypothetical protein SNEBB_005602 [Seison nebaliae]|nr:hypothetical protein SNEBB_005602 [Seison nebaliae]